MKRTIVFVLLMMLVLSACGKTHVTNVAEIRVEQELPAPVADPYQETGFDGRDVSWKSTPNSTCFSSVGYDKYAEILVVVFRDSGKVYYYEDFTQSDWDDFIDASSLGSYYNKNIKGYYPCTKVQPGELVNLPAGANP